MRISLFKPRKRVFATAKQYGKAVEIEKQIAEANAKLAQLQGGHALLKEEVDAEDIAEIVSKWTHIPVSKLMEAEVQKLLTMEDRLRERVVGQELELQTVSDAIRRSRAGLQDPNRPLASFIFLGPTGVGKTEVARQLALYAISVSGSRRSARFGDWGTLAIASALAGRDTDAMRAFFVELALGDDPFKGTAGDGRSRTAGRSRWRSARRGRRGRGREGSCVVGDRRGGARRHGSGKKES